jgi:hypothetical protein
MDSAHLICTGYYATKNCIERWLSRQRGIHGLVCWREQCDLQTTMSPRDDGSVDVPAWSNCCPVRKVQGAYWHTPSAQKVRTASSATRKLTMLWQSCFANVAKRCLKA